jgi:PHD/YefM family antitoxin component YafN of YafNO toxin-antitoxin module
MTPTLLPEHQFSEAKSSLSEVMNEVVHDHRPQVVRRHTREQMLLVAPDDARRWMDTFRLELEVTLDPGQIAVAASPLGLIGVGESFDAALDALVDRIREYVVRFVERPQFYLQSQSARHEPYLLRFALTPLAEHRALLEADMDAAVPQEAIASSV